MEIKNYKSSNKRTITNLIYQGFEPILVYKENEKFVFEFVIDSLEKMGKLKAVLQNRDNKLPEDIFKAVLDQYYGYIRSFLPRK